MTYISLLVAIVISTMTNRQIYLYIQFKGHVKALANS